MAERLSISLPADLARWVREYAHERRVTRSAVVADALGRMRKQELDRRIIEGLQEDAERDRALVREWDGTLPVIPDSPHEHVLELGEAIPGGTGYWMCLRCGEPMKAPPDAAEQNAAALRDTAP